MRRRLALIIATAIITLSMPLSALAHECIVANRSDTGNQNSAQRMWFYIGSEELVGFVSEALGVDPEVYGDAFLAAVEEAGYPTSFSVFLHHTIGENPTTRDLVAAYRDGEKLADGKGIDHIESLFGVYLDIMFSLVG